MRKDAGLPFDLMVFDNGSCAEVRDFLVKEKEEGRIQYLILSEKNMGKGGAWNVMLAGAPGEIIAYTDCGRFILPELAFAFCGNSRNLPECRHGDRASLPHTA